MTENLHQTKPNAVVLGATGAVGTEVVKALLRSNEFNLITTLGRSKLELQGVDLQRLFHHVVDIIDFKSYESFLKGQNVAFCTLGVGQPSKVTQEELYRVDVFAAESFAAACKRQGVVHFTLLTAVGANANSKSYYLRLKGEIENKIRKMGFSRVSFFRPSMLITPNNRYGFLQGLLLTCFPLIDLILFGKLAVFKSIKVEQLGLAMVKNAEKPAKKGDVFFWRNFKELLKGA